MIELIRPNGGADRPKRYGTVGNRRMVRRAIGGLWEYELTITADTPAQSADLEGQFERWRYHGLRDDGWGWTGGRVVQLDLNVGFVTERWSLLEGYANRVHLVYDSGVETVEDANAIRAFGVWEHLEVDEDLTAGLAAAIAPLILQRKLQLTQGAPVGFNQQYKDLATLKIVVYGNVLLQARYVADGTNVGTDITTLPDQQIDTILAALIADDSDLTIRHIATNVVTVTPSELKATNVRGRIEELVDRPDLSEGTPFICSADDGSFVYAAENPNSIYILDERGVRKRGGGSPLPRREWRPGYYENTRTRSAFYASEITITERADIPQFGGDVLPVR